MKKGRLERRQFGAFRIPAQLRVEFLGEKPIRTVTIDISQNGVLVLADHHRDINDFVRLKLYLPPEQTPIEILGRVASKRVVNTKEALGIHFIELASKERDTWLRYVARVETLTIENEKASTTTRALAERRRTGRTAGAFVVRFKESKHLEEFVTKNISAGGLFLSTPMAKTLGEKVQLVLVHPITDRTFELEAEIVRHDDTTSTEHSLGLALKFLGLDDEKEKELHAFMQT